MAQKRGQPQPPLPFSFVPPNFFLDSLRLFSIIFNQIQWLPQLLLKLFMVQFEVPNVSLYGDLYDLFLSHGGKLYDEAVDCRMFPAGYPVLIPPEKADRVYGYYTFVCGDLHGYDLDKVQAVVEDSMKKAQEQIEMHENAAGPQKKPQQQQQQPQRGAGMQQTTSMQNKQAPSSSSSFVLPVILGVGAALAGIAGYFWYQSQTGDNNEPVDDVQQRRANPQRQRPQ